MAAEERGYYSGFANEGLWALCHDAGVKPVFRPNDFETYATVNARFSEAVVEEVEGDSPLVLVQDYHFALAPLYDSTAPSSEHDRRFLAHPVAATAKAHGLPVVARVAARPPGQQHRRISDDRRLREFPGLGRCLAAMPRRQDTERRHARWPQDRRAGVSGVARVAEPSGVGVAACRCLPRGGSSRIGSGAGIRLGIGVDRLDYTKGIVHKLLAIERLLEDHPDLRGRFVFVQIAEPSRTGLTAYRDIRMSVRQCVRTHQRPLRHGNVSADRPARKTPRAGGGVQVPARRRLVLRRKSARRHEPGGQGIRLSRDDERGVLVLSRFAGAAQQLRGALTVNPYKIEESASRLAEALQMPEQEQADRMRSMRTVVAEFNAFWWAGRMIEDAANSRHAGRSTNTIPFAGSSRRRLNFRVGESAGMTSLVQRERLPSLAKGRGFTIPLIEQRGEGSACDRQSGLVGPREPIDRFAELEVSWMVPSDFVDQRQCRPYRAAERTQWIQSPAAPARTHR